MAAPDQTLVLATIGPYAPMTMGYTSAQKVSSGTVDFGALSIFAQLSCCFIKKQFPVHHGEEFVDHLFTGQLTTLSLIHANHLAEPNEMGPWRVYSVPSFGASILMVLASKLSWICLDFALH